VRVINPNEMNCLIYARVSTDIQAEKELSLPAQLQAMRQFATNQGWEVLEEFVEGGASARTAERPVLRQLLSRSKESYPKVDVVLVHKLDRLARNLADHLAVRELLRKTGVRLVSVTENIDGSVSGQLVEHIMAAMAEFYSANLSEEVKKGMRERVRQGGWPHKPPRGYRVIRQGNRSTIAIDPVDGPLVRKAFELCVFGYQGLIDLRRRLATLGLRTKSGKPLSNSALVELLTNPFYCGRLRWNRELYPGAHPALIPVTLFDRVQDVLRRRSRVVQRHPNRFLLAGIARCARCGSFMGGETHRRWQYYRCRGSFRLTSPCRAKYSRMNDVHRAVECIYRDLRLPASVRNTFVRQCADRQVRAEENRRGRRHALKVELAALDQRDAYLAKALVDGRITVPSHELALAELNTKKERLRSELAALGPPAVSGDLGDLATRCRSAWDLHAAVSPEEQRILAETVFESLDLENNRVVAHRLRFSKAA
jgi:site-specific DNA recombinase